MDEIKRAAIIRQLKDLQYKALTDCPHEVADKILVNALTSLGYGDIVAAWDKVPKWYR
jgi:hypothetical protein